MNMACGLANRMFQYSYYLYLGRLGYDVRVDYYRTARLKHEDVAWDRIFPDAPLRQASAWEVFRTGGGGDWLSKVRRRLLWSTCNAKYTSAFEVYLPPREGKPVYVSGVFQNAGMVESVQAEVRKAFAFVPLWMIITCHWFGKYPDASRWPSMCGRGRTICPVIITSVLVRRTITGGRWS